MRERFSRISPARLLVLAFAGAISAGTFLLWLPFAHHGNVGPLEALFHTISAFCNAGFSLYSDSLCRFGGNGLVVGTVMLLIVLGGLGHVVLRELYLDVKRMLQREPLTYARRFSFHTRVVLTVSGGLILGGAVALGVFGLGTEPGAGRIGPLTLVLSFLTTKRPQMHYAEGRVMIG